ncbi:hypothetical protein MKW92_023548, partial [Papaver armeniacum]
EVNDSPIEEVRLTVPLTDDTTLPVLTFRTWIVGPITCVFLSILTEFFEYRRNPILLPATCFTMLFLPIGKLMAATLPTEPIKIPGTKWTFSMNPGPFNMKEHVLLSILATSGMDRPFSLSIVVIAKVFYHKKISFWASFLLVQTSQMIGYGFAGIFMNFLVESPYMWWPYSVLNVSFYRMLHEVEQRPKRQLTRLQFFILASVASFSYHIIPNYFFPSIAALSIVCWIWKDSVTAQQIGSGLHGLGVGSFSLDWSTITGYLGNPLVMPMFAVTNVMAGFILIMYIIAPIAYWTNAYDAKRFPFFSYGTYDINGQAYDVSQLVRDDLTLNQTAYNNYSMVYFCVFSVFSMGFQLGAETATLTHFVLFHARETLNQFKQALKGGDQFNDVHNRLMKKYDPIPHWWFYTIIVSTIVLALLNSMLYGKQFELPYWGILLAYILPFILILPIGVITATTGQDSINMLGLSQLIMGWLYPGNPLANLSFQSYCTTTLSNSIGFISEFKSAHYMKIPPKSLFIAQ